MNNNELNTLMIEAGISTNEAIVKTIKRYRYQVISRMNKKFRMHNFILFIVSVCLISSICYNYQIIKELRVALNNVQENLNNVQENLDNVQENLELCNTPQKIDHYFIIDQIDVNVNK